MSFKHYVVLDKDYFETNKYNLRVWMLERNLQHLWIEVRRANFVDYKIFFDDPEDYVAFSLTFDIKVEG
jgi:hypothetical protein